jgi:hypothetical protein
MVFEPILESCMLSLCSVGLPDSEVNDTRVGS